VGLLIYLGLNNVCFFSSYRKTKLSRNKFTMLILKAQGPRRTPLDTGSPVLCPAPECFQLGQVTLPRSHTGHTHFDKTGFLKIKSRHNKTSVTTDLTNFFGFPWCPGADLNHRHEDFKSTALSNQSEAVIPPST